MKKGDTVTLDKVTGVIIKICYWNDGSQLVRLKHKGGKNSDHFITPDVQPLRSRYE